MNNNGTPATATSLRGYSYAVEIGGRITRIEPLYSDMLDISRLIPARENRPVRIAIVKSDAVPDMSKNDLSRFADNILSNTVTLLVRGTRMARTEIIVNNETEIITATGTDAYDFRTTHGTWQRFTSGTSISGFVMGGTLEFRKAATAANAAGPVMRVRVNNRPNSPAVARISVNNGVFRGVTDKMQYSIDGGANWTDAIRNQPSTIAEKGATVQFRIKATNKTMKSLPVKYIMP
jgi:hypothetical protein